MLYLPPRYAHDGVAVGRVPDLLDRLSHARCAPSWRASCCSALPTTQPTSQANSLYRDPAQPATRCAGAMPAPLQDFAHEALLPPCPIATRWSARWASPSPSRRPTSGSTAEAASRRRRQLVLDRRTRMMYDARHVFINGESLRAAGPRRGPDAGACGPARLDAGDLGAPATSAIAVAVMVRSGLGRTPEDSDDVNARQRCSRRLPGRFAGREAFRQLVRDALACAAREGWREIILSATPASRTGRWASAPWPSRCRTGRSGPPLHPACAALRPGGPPACALRDLAQDLVAHHRGAGLPPADELDFPSAIWSPAGRCSAWTSSAATASPARAAAAPAHARNAG